MPETADLTYGCILDHDTYALAALVWFVIRHGAREAGLAPPAVCDLLSVVCAEGLGWAMRADQACWEALCGDALMLADWCAETQRRALVAAIETTPRKG